MFIFFLVLVNTIYASFERSLHKVQESMNLLILVTHLLLIFIKM